MANGGMDYINDMATRSGSKCYMMGDWTQFDRNIPPWLIRDAFKILEECFDFSKVLDVDGQVRRFTSTVPARCARALNRAISNSCL